MNLRNTYKLAFIGGPDVYLRIELMHVLKDEFDTFAIGSDPEASDRFTEAGFRYYRYKLTRRVNPLAEGRVEPARWEHFQPNGRVHQKQVTGHLGALTIHRRKGRELCSLGNGETPVCGAS